MRKSETLASLCIIGVALAIVANLKIVLGFMYTDGTLAVYRADLYTLSGMRSRTLGVRSFIPDVVHENVVGVTYTVQYNTGSNRLI